jgi:IclR family transcriptional regulator, pca regulon regulatory protein
MVPQSDNHNVYFVPGLHRGLRVLEILGNAETPMTLSEIARAMELSRSSAYRLVYTLRHMEFIKEAEQVKTFTLGARVLNLGFAYLNQQPMTAIARTHLATLRDLTGVSTHLSVLEGQDVLYLISHQARSNYVSNMATGTRTQAYASAIGWCLLGALDEDALAEFAVHQEYVRFTDHTPMTAAALLKAVTQTRERGFVVSKGFRDPGGSSVAVPVRDNTGSIVACVNLSGPDSGFDFDRIESFYIPETKAAALRISRELGYQGD